MRRNITSKLIAGIAVIGMVAAGGSAFTASNTMDPAMNKVVGYGTATVTGATATNVAYTLSDDGSQITAAAITFNGDHHLATVKAGFGAVLTDCATKTYDIPSTSTLVTCNLGTQPVATADTFKVAVN